MQLPYDHDHDDPLTRENHVVVEQYIMMTIHVLRSEFCVVMSAMISV